jgi:IclR family transcriptional regulator, KDG regulon repressor
VTEAKRDYTASLTRGIRLLESFKDHPEQTVADIASSARLSRSSASRLASSLAGSGYLMRDLETRRYSLGLRLWELGVLAVQRRGLLQTSREVMRDLAAESRETIHVAVLDGLDVVYIDKIDGTNAIVAYTRIGGRNPAHAVASGKAMLSALGDEELHSLLPEALPAFTSATITSRSAFILHLRAVRAVGYAVNRGELRDDVGGVASVVRDSSGRPVAALGVTCPITRLTDDAIRFYGQLVEGAAARMSGVMAGRS